MINTRGAKHPPNELCLELVSLVFLHTFFGLAQLCKKPCNLVFNVLQFFKKMNNILLFFIANVSMDLTFIIVLVDPIDHGSYIIIQPLGKCPHPGTLPYTESFFLFLVSKGGKPYIL
jgi:hypothetical protein